MMTARTISVHLVLLTAAVLAGRRDLVAQLSNAETPPSSAIHFDSAHGFSIAPPSGWIVATHAQREQLAGTLTSDQIALLNSLASDRVAVVMFEPDGFSNINIIVSPGRIPLEEADAPLTYRTGLQDQFRIGGMQVDNFRVERRRFGGNDSLLADFVTDRRAVARFGEPPRMRQWQAVFGAWGRTYIVTCSAPDDRFAALEPAFAAALASIDFPATPAAFFRGLPGWVRNALIGALIGAMLPLLPALLRFLSAEPADASPPHASAPPAPTPDDAPAGAAGTAAGEASEREPT
jgi:hypothetical protein